MYIVYNLLFTITINIEMSYYLINTARWQYRIIRWHKYTQVQYLSFGTSLVYAYVGYRGYALKIRDGKNLRGFQFYNHNRYYIIMIHI